MIRSLILLLVLPLVLVACTTPREACIRDSQAQLRGITRQISSTELVLARGYRLVTVRDQDLALTTCIARREDGTSFRYQCQRPVTQTRQEPVAIDYDEERAKLARLKAAYVEAVASAESRIASCPAPS